MPRELRNPAVEDRASRHQRRLGSHASSRAFHVTAKPSGAICNLDCDYCFYREKDKLYPDHRHRWRMSDESLERWVRQYIEAQDVPEVNFAWQGGEPTLMGIDFYERAVRLQAKYSNGKTITNALQTNAVLIDDEWADFLSAHQFLVGVSIDGPRELHDRYRVDRGGRPTFDRVMAGLEALARRRVEFNTLTAVQSHNARHPIEIYRFLKEIGSHFIQFVPIVERTANHRPPDELQLIAPSHGGDATVTEWSVSANHYGQFLETIFDEWIRRDVGRYFVQMIDVALGAWLGHEPNLCVLAETCGRALVVEHNGDLYSCDHYVYPEHKLGNIAEYTIRQLAVGPEQQKFGADKRDTLPKICRTCAVRFVCNGGCPKHRFIRTFDGEPGLSYLCGGYESFFTHIAPAMRLMASELRHGRPAAGVMSEMRRAPGPTKSGAKLIRRNDPCPCQSDRKFKRCCGRT